MKYIKLNLRNITKNEILREQLDLIVDYLKHGKVIIYPTDTIYGLGCLATNKKAIRRIFRIKGRERRKPLLILVGSFKMLKKYCWVSRKQEKYLKRVWKGTKAVSVIFKKKKNLPRELTAGQETVAVRLPKNKFLIKIVEGVGQPIVSTSLNLSGQRNLERVNNLDDYFKKAKPDLVVDVGTIKNKPSRLVDIRDLNDVRVLRK